VLELRAEECGFTITLAVPPPKSTKSEETGDVSKSKGKLNCE
jgi:hypothetical protein